MICYSYLRYLENQKKKAVYALQYQELTDIMKCHLAVFYPQVSMFWESHGAKAGNKFFHISIGHGTCYQPTCQSKGTCLFAPEIKTKNCTKVAVDPKWHTSNTSTSSHLKPLQSNNRASENYEKLLWYATRTLIGLPLTPGRSTRVLGVGGFDSFWISAGRKNRIE